MSVDARTAGVPASGRAPRPNASETTSRATTKERLYVATSVADAVAALVDRGPAGAPLAGATWIMRAPLREERQDLAYVALSAIDALRQVEIREREISIGACVTHAALAKALSSADDWQVLGTAAAASANPAIRQVATVGGNLCAAAFPAADLVPALLCLESKVEIETPDGPERIDVERFLQARGSMKPAWLVRRVIIPRAPRRSVHVRLPLRKAGDYPVAIVSLAVSLEAGDVVSSAKVAVGSVEPVARRWRRLEQDMIGRVLDPDFVAEKAEAHIGQFQGRDGVEAPGWYRLKVLPVLLRRAVEAVRSKP